MIVKTFEQFNLDDISFKFKTLITIPKEIQYIADICKNEIALFPESESVYARILECCLYESHGMTLGHLEFIKPIREILTKSSTEIEAKKQYKSITSPSNITSALLLRMINNIKELKFENEKIFGRVSDKIPYAIKYELTGNTHFSKSYWQRLLGAKILLK